MHHGTIGRLVFATLLAALGTSPPAAAIDLSGDYVVSVPIPCRLTFVQTGTALQVSGSCSVGSTTYPLFLAGTVDPGTGAFSITGDIPGLCADLACSGTGDGEEAHTTCTSSTSACNGPISGTKCGNGVIDPLENCEDGNAVGGDCCSARCRFEPAGTECPSDGQSCTDDVCDVSGTCTHVPSAGPCEDGNLCTIGDVCAGGACVPGSPAPAGQACGGDFDPCTTDVCDAAGACTHVPVPPEVCRRAATCHSTCTQQLKECRQTCPGRGPARRDCRAACAAESTCTAPGAPIRTLAYVMTECTTDPQRRTSLKQTLFIRRGNCDPVPAVELDEGPPRFDRDGLCSFVGAYRRGDGFRVVGAFQRLAVLPDGSGVVFEVTNRFSLLPGSPPPAEGFFFVRPDGTGFRRLADASRLPPARGSQIPGVPFDTLDSFPVSPDGREIALIDLGPNAAGHEAPQIFLLDLRSGRRLQLTHNPSDLICCQRFLNSRTVTYGPLTGGNGAEFMVKTNGKSPEKEIPPPVLVEGTRVVPQFTVTGARPQLLYVNFHDRPAVNGGSVSEMFLLDGKNLLQLTSFGRNDTFQLGGFIARGRVLFPASADLHGENPANICQLFAIDTFGAHLHQLTHLPSGGRPGTACAGVGSGCGIPEFFLDLITGTVLFASSCDPVGANPFGEQLFAMRPDGTGLRQLTNARGMTTDADGTIHVELPGPFAYTSRPGG